MIDLPSRALAARMRGLAASLPFAGELKGRSFFITGATGFLGSALTYALLAVNELYGSDIRITCCARSEDKTKAMFGTAVDFVKCDLAEGFKGDICADYAAHFASPTSSKYFVEHPAETLLGSINFCADLAQAAARADVKGLIYLSSLEVYGTDGGERKLGEDSEEILRPLNVRNSYPLAKIACEELLNMYHKTRGLPVRIARLTQTFGEGIGYDDGRVFAQFARAAAEGRDIVLRSYGRTKRCYCDVADAVSALLYILLRGRDGQAYNVAGDGTYVSINELAALFAAESAGRTDIVYDIGDAQGEGYLPENMTFLKNDKLKELGWRPQRDIERMVKDFCAYFKSLRASLQ